jgi:hypothetical protein
MQLTAANVLTPGIHGVWERFFRHMLSNEHKENEGIIRYKGTEVKDRRFFISHT